MLFFPVWRSRLGVLWHREHLACSIPWNDEDDDDSELSELSELSALSIPSLVTCKTFWMGQGLGLLGDWPAVVDRCSGMSLIVGSSKGVVEYRSDAYSRVEDSGAADDVSLGLKVGEPAGISSAM